MDKTDKRTNNRKQKLTHTKQEGEEQRVERCEEISGQARSPLGLGLGAHLVRSAGMGEDI